MMNRMNRRKFLGWTLAAGSGLFLPASIARAEAFAAQMKNDSAQAYFYSVSGQISTRLYVFASNGILHEPPGAPEDLPVAGVAVSIYDWGNQVWLMSADGETTSFDFSLTVDLSSAALQAVVPVTDIATKGQTNLTVNITWTATEDMVREARTGQYDTGSHLIVSRYHGSMCNGSASGTVMDDTTNLTPEPSISANMLSVGQGVITVTRNKT